MKFTYRTLLMSLAGASLGLSFAATAQETPAQSAPTEAPAQPATSTTDVPASTVAPAPAPAETQPATPTDAKPAEQPAPEADKDKAEKPKK